MLLDAEPGGSVLLRPLLRLRHARQPALVQRRHDHRGLGGRRRRDALPRERGIPDGRGRRAVLPAGDALRQLRPRAVRRRVGYAAHDDGQQAHARRGRDAARPPRRIQQPADPSRRGEVRDRGLVPCWLHQRVLPGGGHHHIRPQPALARQRPRPVAAPYPQRPRAAAHRRRRELRLQHADRAFPVNPAQGGAAGHAAHHVRVRHHRSH
mmetsp:Transcript_1508/g.4761  ORF Transcript_1508/g.4761 Transcript_1508/m.4761 type:complete len:209 (-) Transcript_1508:1198-1824(-)